MSKHGVMLFSSWRRSLLFFSMVAWFVTPAFATDWPMIGGDLARTGVARGASAKPPFVNKWVYDMTVLGCTGGQGLGTIVADGMLFYCPRNGICHGTAWIYALNSQTGAFLWNYDAKSDETYLPQYESGILYFGVGMLGGAGPWGTRALRTSDQSVLWTAPTYESMVAKRGDTVYALSQSDGIGSSTLFALDASSGTIRWSATVSPPAGGADEEMAIDERGYLYVAGRPLMSIVDDGAMPHVRWSFTFNGGYAGRPTVTSRRVYYPQTPAPGALYALDRDSGLVAWSFTTTSVIVTCAADGSTVYLPDDGASNPGGTLYAVAEIGSSPSLAWKARVDHETFNNGQPVIANGVVYIDGNNASGQTIIAAVDSLSGNIVWSGTMAAGFESTSVSYADGLLYSATANFIYCFGKPISLSQAVDKQSASPGDGLNYTLTINSYGGPSTAVIVTETLPAGVTFVSASGGGVVSGSVVSWNGVAVTAQTLQTLTLQARVNPGLPVGTYSYPVVGYLTYTGSTMYNEVASDVVTTTVTVNPPTPTVYTGAARVFPNPFNRAAAVRGTVKFQGVPSDGRVRLFTSGGLLVWQASGGPSVLEWDGRGAGGKPVAPGVYLWLVEGGGKTQRGKLVIE